MNKIHFVGIGGIGMSALARLYLSKGIVVTGSDASESELLEELREEGVEIIIGHKEKNVPMDADLLVYSEAVPPENPERRIAQERNIKEKSYFQALGDVAKDYEVIAVAGTHGKSTTTSMLALAMEKMGLDPTVIVGTKVFEWGKKNFRLGQSKYFVLEACEYRNSFLNLKPKVAVITSVEPEHLDFFGTPEKYFDAFKNFLQNAEIMVADFLDYNVRKVAKDFNGIKFNTTRFLTEIPKLQIPGKHNIDNASKVLGVFAALEEDIKKAKESIVNFKGTWRRFEKKGEKNGAIIYDDYGHHPTEVKATLFAFREKYPDKRIICVFQPHQFSRTEIFLKEFGQSFKGADLVLVPNIYRVRDKDMDVKSVTVEDLVAEMVKNGTDARFTDGFENTANILKNEIKDGDVVVTMGAGPVYEVGEMLLN